MRRQSFYGADLLPCLDYQNFHYGAKMKTDKGKTWADIPVVPRAREAKGYPRGAPQPSLTMVGSGDTPCTARGGAGLGGRRLSQEALEGVSPPSPHLPHRGCHWASGGFKRGRPKVTGLVKSAICPVFLLPDDEGWLPPVGPWT